MKNAGARVCVITTVHYCFDTRVYYRELRSLSRAYEVDYYAPCRDGETGIECSGAFFPLRTASTRLRRLATQVQVLRLLRGRRYALYLLHDPELLPLGMLLKAAGKKVIFDMHENVLVDIGSKSYLHPAARRGVLALFRVVFGLAQRMFDWFILAERSYPAIMSTDRHTVVLNFPLFRDIDVPTQKTWPQGLVYVGSITEARGLWEMLAVFRLVHEAVPAATLHLVGPVDEAGLERRILEWLECASLTQSVLLHGRIPNERTFEIIGNCGIGLCLLSKKMFSAIEPTKIFEYMMARLPVVVSDCASWKTIVAENRCGAAVDPDRPREAADAIVALLRDGARRQEMGENGLMAVKKKFNWSTEEKKMLGLYRDLIGR